MGAGPSLLSIIMLIASGGPIAGDDLLGFVDTKAYWRQKNVAMTVAAITAELKVDAEASAANPQAAAVRRLMAIRTLGELKNKAALVAFPPLLKSKELFVADYAARAVAAIEGKKWVRHSLTKAMRQKDLALLPSGCGVVGQATIVFDKVQDLDKTLKATPLPGGVTKDELLKKLTETVLQVAERVGNIRLDSITLGIARDMGNGKGYFVVVARGLYDAKAAASTLAPMMRETSEIDGVKVYRPHRDFALMFPDNSRLIVVGGPKRDLLPLDDVISALKAGKAGLQNTPEMARLVKSVDVTASVWAVAEMSETYRQEALLAPLKWITLTGKEAKGATKLALAAEASDAKALSDSLAKLEQVRQEDIREMQKALAREPILAPLTKPFVELFQSVKVVQDGKKATLTATMKGTSPGMVIPFVVGRYASVGVAAQARRARRNPGPGPDGF